MRRDITYDCAYEYQNMKDGVNKYFNPNSRYKAVNLRVISCGLALSVLCTAASFAQSMACCSQHIRLIFDSVINRHYRDCRKIWRYFNVYLSVYGW